MSQDAINDKRSLYLLLNGREGIRTESFTLKPGSINAIQEKMFSDGLDNIGAAPDVVESLKTPVMLLII